MNEKELKKLNRKQLLELLLQQSKKMNALQAQLDDAREALKNKMVNEKEAGSIAEASLKVNDIFVVAQAAADQYLDNIKRLEEEQKKKNKQIEAQCINKASKMITEVEKRCKARESASKKKAYDIIVQTEDICKKRDMESQKTLSEVQYLYRYLSDQKKHIEAYLEDPNENND